MNNKIIANILLQTIRIAGSAVLHLQKTDFTITKKSNNDIVTKADLLANEILITELLGKFPDYGWLSEETADDAKRLQCKRVWIVDPIDGTKEFAAKIPEYAISVALVEDGLPIVSAVFNPATNELFHAIVNEGAWLNDDKISCNHAASAKDMLLLASRSEYQRGEWDLFAQQHRVQQIGSIAYKLALIAAGKGDATFSLGPKSEWDIAGGILLVTEAGGFVTDQSGKQFLLNRENVLVNGIVAAAPGAREAVFAMIGRR